MDAMTAAENVKKVMVAKFSSTCGDPQEARKWYEDNIDIWDQTRVMDHIEHNPSCAGAQAGVALHEDCPDSETQMDCWGVEISYDRDVAAAIPGWYLDCGACWLVLVHPVPDLSSVETYE
jgi:hypothetical protein